MSESRLLPLVGRMALAAASAAFNAAKEPAKDAPKQARNRYDAAGTGRRSGWTSSLDSDVNSVNQLAQPHLVARSRDMVRNNPYASRAVKVIASNTVGTGIVPTAKGGTARQRKKANELMQQWLKQCDFHERLDLFGLQNLAMKTQVQSGEVLAIRHFMPESDLVVPLKIQLLEGDWLDSSKNFTHTQNNIRQGIQLDRSGRRTGYWIYEDEPTDARLMSAVSKLMPKTRVAHMFEDERPGQLRGIPSGVSGFTRLKGLNDFQDARIEQQKIAACLALAFVIDDAVTDDEETEILPDRLTPGAIPLLRHGADVKFSNPPSVSGQGEFLKDELHAVAAAYGITYEALTGDYSNVNFSSGRMGWIEFWRNIESWRWTMIVPQLLEPIAGWFVEAAALRGHDLTGVTFEWTAPRREMIDPTKEIPAMIKAIRAGLKPWQETVRELGYEPEQVLIQLAQDKESWSKFGLVLDCDPAQITTAGQMQATPPGEQPDPEETDEE